MALNSPLSRKFRRVRNRTPFRARGRGGQWNPNYLAPIALYDHAIGGTSTTTPDSSGNALAAVAFGASTAAPTHLAYGGTPYIYQGVTSRFNTPNHTDYNTTDLDVWVDVALENWATPSATTGLAARMGADPNRQWRMEVSTAGKLVVVYYPTGSAASAVTFTSTDTVAVASGVAAGGRCALRFTLDVDNGAGGYQLNMQYRLGGYDGTWTTFYAVTGGAPVASPTVNRILEFGTAGAGGPIQAFYGGRAHATIDGTVLARIDPAGIGQGTSYTDPEGRVWTMNYPTSGLTMAVKSGTANDTLGGVVTDGVNDTATGPAGAIPALAAADGCTLWCVVRPRATMVSGQVFFTTRSGTGAGITLRMASATTVVADVSDGVTTATTPAVTITPGTRCVLGVVATGGAPGTAYVIANNTAGATVARTGNTETGGALTIFSSSTPDNWCRTHARVLYGSVASVLDSSQIAKLVAYYGGGL